MKTNILSCLLCLIAWFGQAQSVPSRIYIVKNGAQTLGALRFYTTLDPNQVIKVKNNAYALIETEADSLGILKETSYSDSDNQSIVKKVKPIFIKLEAGKSYYFKIGPIMYSSHLDVEEMTDRAFQLYIGLNELENNPTKYILSSSKGLTKSSQ